MTILENVMNRFGFVSEKQFETRIQETLKRELEKVLPWQGETADAQRWSLPDPTVFANQADLYRISPILGTAIDLLGRKLGTSKFEVSRLRGEELTAIPNHPFELLLQHPNPMQSGLELMQETGSNYMLNGNSVWWLNKRDEYAEPDEIWSMPYHMLEPVPDGRLYLSHYNYFPGNGKEAIRFETWEIVHYKNFNPFSRFYGLSPIESLAVTITGDLAMRKTNTVNYAEYGGAPKSILAFKEYVPNPAWEDIKSEKRQAAKRNEMMMLRGVGDGVTWMQRALSNKDMDFVAGLRQNMLDVFHRMCPGLLAMLDPNSTEANALAARATFAEYTLHPLQEAIAQKITLKILPAYGIKLVGHFEDPRVVDRKLKLEEQLAYERTHTYEEVRREFYGHEPLGDERDNQLIGQAQVAPEPTPPAENMTTEQDTDADDSVVKAAIGDLQTWRRMALRGKFAKAQDFKSEYLPASTVAAIKRRLDGVNDKGKIAALFDGEIERFLPKPKADPTAILQGIEAGVRALEASRVTR